MKTDWGEQLRAWRKAKNLFSKQAADLLKVSIDTWRAWECGQHTPHDDRKQEIERRMKAYVGGSGEPVKVNVK